MTENSEQLSAVKTLDDFLSSSGKLTLDDRKMIVEQATILLEQTYVHLPLKIAMYAVDPIGKLRILRRHLDETSTKKLGTEIDFHKEMLEIFTSVRDLHTNYLLPEPFSNYYAILPFLIGSYDRDSQNRIFLVTHVFDEKFKPFIPSGFIVFPRTFKAGVEITHWNGIPMERAVKIIANINAGSNSEARFARGLEAMTIRPMRLSLPPDEEWVVIGYKTEDGQELEYRQKWLMVPRDIARAVRPSKPELSFKIGLDLTTELVTRMKQALFAPNEVIESGTRLAKEKSIDDIIAKAEGLKSVFPKVFRAEKISKDIGLVRIYKFSEDDPDTTTPDQLVNEFRRLISNLPQKGLIIDVRGNGGGWITFAERVLQFLTPREIIPEPYEFISSPITLEMTRDTSDPDLESWELEHWHESLVESANTGSIFSRGIPITTPEEANDIGQIYYGPVVLLTDALCYSATDLLAAGFQDHEIGPIIGVDANTGAGGANVVEYGRHLTKLLDKTKYALKALPGGSDMRVSLRRNVRIGKRAGTPVEDLGIVPDIFYNMTRRDHLKRNVDLYKKASNILASKTVRQFEAVLSHQAGHLTIKLSTLGISRIDIYVDDKPILSKDVRDGTSKLTIEPPVSKAKLVKILGFEGSKLVGSKKNIC